MGQCTESEKVETPRSQANGNTTINWTDPKMSQAPCVIAAAMQRDIRPAYRGELSPLKNLDGLEREWRELEARASCSFFLSWSWIGTWLKLVQEKEKSDLHLYRCYCNHELVGLAIVAACNVKRRILFSSRILTLNEVSDESLNMFIEHNGVLTKRGHELATIEQALYDLLQSDLDWDEIQLNNIPKESYQSLHFDGKSLQARDEIEHAIWIAPLYRDTSIDSIIGRMSKNRRWQMRRTFKEYEKEGRLSIKAATNTHEALMYFQQLGILHTLRWERAGKKGSFTQQSWVAFHQSLIATAFDRGEVQLLQIRCGARTIGYLYNFLWRNTVHMLQSGFVIEQSNLLRPGYVSHILAMQLNAMYGSAQYDFMSGDAEYKRVLAEPYPPLVSARLQKTRVKFFFENCAVELYRAFARSHPAAFSHVKKIIAAKTRAVTIALSINSMFGREYLNDLIG